MNEYEFKMKLRLTVSAVSEDDAVIEAYRVLRQIEGVDQYSVRNVGLVRSTNAECVKRHNEVEV
jgi:hypothetical protein